MGRIRVGSGGVFEDVYGYSRAVRVGDQIHVAGTTAREPGLDGDAYVQAKAALSIVEDALRDVGSGLDSVVRTVAYVTDMGDRELVARAHREVFGEVRPAATLVAVAGLVDPRMKVEIEVYAIDDREREGDGEPEVLSVRGRSTSQRVIGPECASPVGLCTRGRMTGTITGDYESVATELTPSTVPGMLYVRATTVVTTAEGELRLEEHAVVNTSPDGFGEHTSLGEITGGTGVWSGATGYLHAVGDSATGANASTLSGRVRLRRSTPGE